MDCASLPESLLEAELFGYEKGAFTGAVATKPGLMESADRGTLFLDEVGELPFSLQAKLLRALQEKEHRRVGGTQNIKFDVRVIAATNRDLHQCVKEGTFREDLLFRLDVIPIRLPPLREREGDVTLLANYFLEKYAEADTGMTKIFDPEVLRFFESYPWPGNVRELQNVVRRMCVLAEGSVITMCDLPKELLPSDDEECSPLAANSMIAPLKLGFMEAKRHCLNLFEAAYRNGYLTVVQGTFREPLRLPMSIARLSTGFFGSIIWSLRYTGYKRTFASETQWSSAAILQRNARAVLHLQPGVLTM